MFWKFYKEAKEEAEAYENFKKLFLPKWNLYEPTKKQSNKINFDFLESSKNIQNIVSDDIIQKIIDFYSIYKIELLYYKNITGFSSILLYYKIMSKTKIKQVENLVNDLQLFLQIKNIEIIEDIEEGSIVFQIPKKTKNILSLKKVATSSNDNLQIGLGFTPQNEKILLDITKQPHLLVAGTTGSRKVCIFEWLNLSTISKICTARTKFCFNRS